MRIPSYLVTKLNSTSTLSTTMLFVLIIMLPRPAFAIPNPFTLVFLAALGWQLLLGLVLMLPVWLYGLTSSFKAWPSYIRFRLIAILTATVLALFHFLVPDTPNHLHPSNQRESYARSCEPLGKYAVDIGLGPKDILLDPRLPAQFAMYHVKGACNVDPERLRGDLDFRHYLESTGDRIVLIAEFRITVADLYNDILNDGYSSQKWMVLDSGTMFFRLGNGGNAELVSGPIKGDYHVFMVVNTTYSYQTLAPFVVADPAYFLATPNRFGQQLTRRSGPFYSSGWSMSILGSNKAWLERRQSWLFGPDAHDVVKIKVVDSSQKPFERGFLYSDKSKTLTTGRVGASMAALDKAAGYQIEKAIFLCDNSMSCPAAEILAREQLDRGGQVLGYVTENSIFDEYFRELLNKKPRADFGQTYFAILIALSVSVVLHIAVTRRIRRFSSKPFADSVLRITASFGPAVIGWVAVYFVAESFQPGIFGLYLTDAGRVGLLGLSMLYFVAVLLLAISILTFSTKTKWFWLVSTILFLGFMALPPVTGITVLEAVTLILTIAGTPLLARATEGGKKGDGWQIIPLRQARIESVGQKARWLAIALDHLPNVLPGFVVLVDDPEQLTPSQLEKISRFLKRLGPGKRIVRSTAPGEDTKGAATSGKYASVPDVLPGDEGKAILEVLKSYGLAQGQRAAVIVQNQLAPKMAGVATREEQSQGGGILVEAALGDIAAVTSGKAGGIISGRIGAFSRSWHRSSDLPPAKAFLDIFAILERRFGQPIMIEWAFNGHQLLVLQVRPTAFANQDQNDFTALAKTLSKHRLSRKQTVLDCTMFPEFSNGTSALTIELVKEIYEAGSIIKSWSYQKLANTGPKPQVVLINQKLFMNMVPSRLVSYFLVKPFVWFTNFLWRLAPHRIIDETLGDIRASYKKLQEAALQDLKPLQLWALVTSELARDFLTAGIIVDILAKGQDLTMDPVLAAAGKGSIAKLAIDFPYRSLSEWSLETPRLGADDLDLMLGAFVKRDQFFPMPKTPADQALTLLALARDSLSFAVAILRLALLREFGGNTGIFNRSFQELETGFDFKHPQPLKLIQPKPGAPSKLNLIQLEQWISGDAVDQAKSAGFWVSCKGRVIGVVDGDGSNAGHIIKVVEHPTVQDVISLPKNAVLVALSGNRLSHAAQVLRDRKIPGLFGAAKFADKLQPGNTVVIDEDGVIENAS